VLLLSSFVLCTCYHTRRLRQT